MVPEVPSEPFALFLDVDGTLLDIAERPDWVVVPDDLRADLDRLDARLGGAVALVSGRAISDLDGLFSPLRLRASGVHGAETRTSPEADVVVSPGFRLPDACITGLRSIAARYPGTLVEDKSFSVAIHYRAAPAAGLSLRQDLDRFLQSPDGEGCKVLPGHMVFEIKRAGFDKGTAIAAFLGHPIFLERRPIFIGDDITDLPGFDQVLSRHGLAYSVTTPRPGLSGHFPHPAAVRAWLSRMAAESW